MTWSMNPRDRKPESSTKNGGTLNHVGGEMGAISRWLVVVFLGLTLP